MTRVFPSRITPNPSHVFMAMAFSYSSLSSDPLHPNAAIVVDKNKSIVCSGFNKLNNPKTYTHSAKKDNYNWDYLNRNIAVKNALGFCIKKFLKTRAFSNSSYESLVDYKVYCAGLPTPACVADALEAGLKDIFIGPLVPKYDYEQDLKEINKFAELHTMKIVYVNEISSVLLDYMKVMQIN